MTRQCVVRHAAIADAEALLDILRRIVAAGVYTAIAKPWTVERQREYLAGLRSGEAVFVAEDRGGIVGYQAIELWAPGLGSMDHVAQVGTFVAPEARGRGLGKALFEATARHARAAGIAKFVVQVRAANTGAQAFYRGLGFEECGRLRRQVRIGGMEDDEILMEYFL